MMNRREFVQLSAGASAALAMPAVAQSEIPAGQAWKIDIYSRHLQWLRSGDEIGAAAKEMGYDSVDITVRPYPGHVDPAKVKTDLPPFVKAVRSHGVMVRAITCPIADVNSPHAEQILDTASNLGIHHYWWGSFQYVKGQPIMPQLDALKPRVEKLVALNEKYGMTAMYHTYGGEHTIGEKVMVGGPMWDMLYVLRDFDPKRVGLHYDSCHMTNAGGFRTWELNLRLAGPYVRGVSMKDSLQEKGKDGRWGPHYMPLGKGNVELVRMMSILREIQFDGPIEIQPEHMKGAAGEGMDKLEEPRDEALKIMQEDLRVLRAAIVAS